MGFKRENAHGHKTKHRDWHELFPPLPVGLSPFERRAPGHSPIVYAYQCTFACTHTLTHTHTHTHTYTHKRTHTNATAHTHCTSQLSTPIAVSGGLYRNVIRMQWDCGKNPILISLYLTGIPLHSTIGLTLFQKCGGNKTVHRSGLPPRTRNFLKEHLVHFFWKIFMHEVFF